MPKLKTHSASKKRFSLTGTGKVKRGNAERGHLLISKSKRAKRNHRKSSFVGGAQASTIKQLIPYK
jgi:large subunit ribosomal protein L35